MRLRKLRIAWSVFWGLACVLLIVLWVRSYFRVDMVVWDRVGSISSESGIRSWRGGLELFYWHFQPVTRISSHLVWKTESGKKWRPLINEIGSTYNPHSFSSKKWPAGW